MKATKIVNLVAAAGLMASGAAFAASQGTVGATSQGESVVTVTIPSLIRINGLTDITLGNYAGTGDMSGSSPGAVCSNGATNYGIVATSAAGSFELQPQGAAVTTIPYTVTWAGTATPAQLTYNTNEANQDVDATVLGPCAGVAGKLTVDILEADLQAASADDYEDTVILTVTPE